MPKAPSKDCPLCAGAGVITDSELTQLKGPARAPGDPVACLCTVSLEDIGAARNDQISELRKRSDEARRALGLPPRRRS